MQPRPIALAPTSPQQPIQARVALAIVAGIGTPALAEGFLGAMQQLLPLTLCTVFALGAKGRVVTVSTASHYGNAAAVTAETYIQNRFDVLDPNMRWLAARALPKAPRLWLSHQRGDTVADPAYRAACYGDVGIRERTSVLLLLPGGQRAAVSFYRSLAQPEFSQSDFNLIAAHAALLAEATAAHSRGLVAARRDAGAGNTARLRDRLSPERLLLLSLREQAVIHELMAGHTAKQTAQALGIALSTVRSHQYQAFRRLGIGSLKELLLMARGGESL